MSDEVEITEWCPTCKFYNSDAKCCTHQGSGYYYRSVPKNPFTCSKFIPKKKPVEK